MEASVIIASRNRPASVRTAVESLVGMKASGPGLEVLVVDDGSQLSQSYDALAGEVWPFRVAVVHQAASGATIARNRGASQAEGEVLVFMDDDIVPLPPSIPLLVQQVLDNEKTVALGTLITKPPSPVTPFAEQLMAQERKALAAYRSRGISAVVEISRTDCLTGLLAIRRADFEALGGFQDPTGGWPNWDDVDFGVRASQAGFRLVRLTDALAEHRDRVVADLASAAERYRRASRSAVRLFLRYPDLRAELPMFHDMTPIAWGHDPPRLVARKALRRLSSTRPSREMLTVLSRVIERVAPNSAPLGALYRWTVGAAICLGYREGLATHQ